MEPNTRIEKKPAPSRMVAEFLQCLAEEKMNQAQFAEASGASTANVSRFVGGSAPEDTLLRQLCTGWTDKTKGRRILLAHLADEAMRSGLDPSDFVLEIRGVSDRPAYPGLEADFGTIRRSVEGADDVLLTLIKSVAALAIEGKYYKKKARRSEKARSERTG